MPFLETFLSDFPVLSVINATQSVCVTAPVVAIGCPVHLSSLASYHNSDNLEDFKIYLILRIHFVTCGSPKRPSR